MPPSDIVVQLRHLDSLEFATQLNLSVCVRPLHTLVWDLGRVKTTLTLSFYVNYFIELIVNTDWSLYFKTLKKHYIYHSFNKSIQCVQNYMQTTYHACIQVYVCMYVYEQQVTLLLSLVPV